MKTMGEIVLKHRILFCARHRSAVTALKAVRAFKLGHGIESCARHFNFSKATQEFLICARQGMELKFKKLLQRNFSERFLQRFRKPFLSLGKPWQRFREHFWSFWKPLETYKRGPAARASFAYIASLAGSLRPTCGAKNGPVRYPVINKKHRLGASRDSHRNFFYGKNHQLTFI